ncbi:MAG: redoxin domain-containing protein [Spirosomataceae bacterium]
MALQVGDKAPAFKLFNTDKKEVSLEDFKGKNLVIQFFPAAFTGVCTNQMCEMRDSMARYNSLNAEVVGVSVDMPFTLGQFKAAQELNFDLLSDFNKNMIKDYGVYRENFVLGLIGVANRAAFVVDGEGTIKYAEVLDNPGNLPNFAAMNEVISSL